MECLLFNFYIFETCKEKRWINSHNLLKFVKKRLKLLLRVWRFERECWFTLPEQHFSETDRKINKNNKMMKNSQNYWVDKQIKFKEKTSKR